MRNDNSNDRRQRVPLVNVPPSMSAIGEAFLAAARSGVLGISGYAVAVIMREATAIDERNEASN